MRVRRRPPMRLRRLRLHLFRLLSTLLVVDWCVALCLLTVRAVLLGSILPLVDCTPFRRRSTDTGCFGRLRPALHRSCSSSCPYGHPRVGRAQRGGARY